MLESDLKNLESWMREIDKKLDNHLVHTADNISQIRVDVSQVKNDIDWIKRFFWLVAGISVTAIGGALFGLILK